MFVFARHTLVAEGQAWEQESSLATFGGGPMVNGDNSYTEHNLCTVDQQCIALISYVDIVYQCTQFCAVPKRHGKGADAANAKNVTWPSLTPSIAVMRTGALLGVGFGACMLGLCLMKGTLKPDRLPNRKKNNSLKPRCKWRLWLA